MHLEIKATHNSIKTNLMLRKLIINCIFKTNILPNSILKNNKYKVALQHKLRMQQLYSESCPMVRVKVNELGNKAFFK